MVTKKPRSEAESRLIRVGSISRGIGLYANKQRGIPPYLESFDSMELRGLLDEPVEGTTEVAVSLHCDQQQSQARGDTAGAIIQTRPLVRAVIGLPPSSFDRAWSMANSGLLRFCWLAFTKPRWHNALIKSVSLSDEAEA